ncbi:hypothetical protein GK011_19425 [Erwinia sp. J316]|uniref:PDZ domain-containing protein n=2 Tax=Erwinia sorbitola TaxID=2681984 RepID=A0ABW9RGE0_9GAMM|nr:hypothetical protein [Erwinia sorbitola]
MRKLKRYKNPFGSNNGSGASITRKVMKHSVLLFSFTAVLLSGTSSALAEGEGSAYLAAPPLLTVPVRPDVLIVPVKISGRQYHFLLDTGISTTLIDNALAKQLTEPLPDEQVPALHRSTLAVGVYTEEGPLPRHVFKFWQPLAMALGDAVIPASVPWLGADLSSIAQVTGIRVDGVLGMDIFRQFAWQVDNQQQQLTLWQQAPGTLDYPVCVPYRDSYDSGPQLMLDYHDLPVPMTVNTGVDYSYIGDELIKVSRERPQSAVLTGINQPMLGLNGQEVSDGYSLAGLSFNLMPLGKLLARENKHGAFGLGMNFLARFDRYLFLPEKMLFCYQEQNFTRDEPAPQRVLAVRYYQQRIELFSNPSPALARFGLQNGDVLLEVNGNKVMPERIYHLRNALADTPAGELKLKIERRGKMKTITI